MDNNTLNKEVDEKIKKEKKIKKKEELKNKRNEKSYFPENLKDVEGPDFTLIEE